MNISRLKNNKNLDTNQKISFYFDGKNYSGYKGDTLASALLANNVHLVGRSFKYHRPRGLISAGPEEPNGIVQLENGNVTEPNRRATEVLLYEGLTATSQNRWPNIKFDFGAINDLLSPFFPAGFYYKTFMWPPNFWKKYEFFIRHAAGLGKSPEIDDPHQYEHYHYHCDLLIVGSGVSGLYAAEMAAEQGLKILLVEQEDELGGSLLSDQTSEQKINDLSLIEWKNKILNNLKTKTNIKIIKSTTLFAYMHYNYLLAIQDINPLDGLKRKNNIRQIIWKIRAKKIILATGSIERPLTFDNNDRPGIMLANSASKFLNYYGVKLANEIVVFTNNDSAYQTAIDFHKKGINVKAVIDVRSYGESNIIKKTESLGIKIYYNHAITNTSGRLKIKSVTINKVDDSVKKIIGDPVKIKCDFLCVSGGWTPTVHLFTQSRGKLIYRENDGAFIPKQSFQETISIGSCNGTFSLNEILDETFLKIKEVLISFDNIIKIDQKYKSKPTKNNKHKHA